MIEQPVGVNDRIMKLRIPLSAGRFLTLVSVYAPTLVSSEEKIASFYHALRSVVSSVPNSEMLVVLGDLNARVGSDAATWPSLGPHGVGKLNSNGLLLLQLCNEHNLVITNTFSNQKNKATWIHPQSKNGHMLDHIICRRADLRSFCKVRVMRGANFDTDHYMLRAKLRISIRRKCRSNGVKIPKRINVAKLKNPDIKSSLMAAFDQVDFTSLDWDGVRDVIYGKGVEILGLKSTKHRDWFDENADEVNSLIDAKRKAHLKLLNSSPANRQSSADQYSSAKRIAQRRIRQIKNKWWSDLSDEIQTAYNRRDLKEFYGLLRQAYGPKSSSVSPLLTKDGNTMLKSPDEIGDRWYEHFRDLFHNPSIVDSEAVDSIPQQTVCYELDAEPSLEETMLAIKQINSKKAPGLDGIPIELLKHGGTNLLTAIHALIVSAWKGEPIPQDWVDVILIMLYKGKGKKSICGSYRGISLLESVGKVFSRILLNRLEKHICPSVIPESQSGFRGGRGTVDMIFSARQLVEKSLEQHVPLCQVFVDLTKAFDTVNRDALWKVLGKFGCTTAFVEKFRQLHRDMKGRVNFDGRLSEELPIDNGVKQGDIPGPTLFSLYLTAVLWYAFHDCDKAVYFRFRTTGKVFNLKRLRAETLVSSEFVRELLYADDADFVSHSPEDMQDLMDRFSNACTKFGLTISTDKTKVMYTPAPGEPQLEPVILVYGKPLEVVRDFVYLGSSVSDDGNLDAEIKKRISKASISFGRLEDRVWSDGDLTIKTKMTVYETCVLTALLYASETWTIFQPQMKVLERFHQNCLRRILQVKWQNHVPDTEVLSKAGSVSITSRVMRNQLRWAGHLVRLDDTRLPKQLFYSELRSGSRPQHKPKKRFKDSLKDSLRQFHIPVDEWESLAVDRDSWRKRIFDGAGKFEKARTDRIELKRACRKHEAPLAARGDVWICNICGRYLLSKAGWVNHLKSHNPGSTQPTSFASSLPDNQQADFTCPHCTKVCKSSGGLKRHLKIHSSHDTTPYATIGNLHTCSICRKACKTLAGLKSHLRAHGRETTDGVASF